MKYELDYFIDESIQLYQNPNDFRFNTDTKLLAKFIHLKKQERILDIGTNNGVLLLYLDQYNVKELVGVEILEESYKLAVLNRDKFIKHSCRIINGPIQEYKDELFDVIISNPPYFKLSANQKIENMNARHLSRMEENLTLEELIDNAARLIKSYGRFYMVHRPNRLNEIIKILHDYNFNIRNLQFAYDSRNNVVKSVLIESIKDSNCDMIVKEPIYI
jgi:tRNA1(Val) A37 N6-methylase TrmN6